MNDLTQTPEMLISNMGQRARRAAALLAGASDAQKAQALRSAAQALRDGEPDIIAANQRDMEKGAANGLSPAMLDRLKLDSARIQGIAGAVEAVAELADPVGAVIDKSRSEEHTSELQSLMRISYAVFCLKNKNRRYK